MVEQAGKAGHEHGGMNHGMGMMLGCLVPMAAIALLPRLGVSFQVSLMIGVVGMVACHAGMAVVHRLRARVNRHKESVPLVDQPHH